MTVVIIRFSRLLRDYAEEVAEFARNLGFMVFMEEDDSELFKVITPYGVFRHVRDAKWALQRAAEIDKELKK